jgi:hypothetical protein
VTSPVTGRPSRGRLYAGTALREEPASSEPEDADADRPDEVPPLPLGELPPLLRGVAVPVLLLPLLRVRADCSFDRRGASNDDLMEEVDSGDDGAVQPELALPASPLDPLLLPLLPVLDPPPSPPLGTAEPPPSPPPRGAAVPVVFPFDVRSSAEARPERRKRPISGES